VLDRAIRGQLDAKLIVSLLRLILERPLCKLHCRRVQSTELGAPLIKDSSSLPRSAAGLLEAFDQRQLLGG